MIHTPYQLATKERTWDCSSNPPNIQCEARDPEAIIARLDPKH
jgi:hypothetical protein